MKRTKAHPWLAAALLGVVVQDLNAQSSSKSDESCTPPAPFYEGRIVTPEDVERSAVPAGAKPLWILGWPCRGLYGAMEKGLVKFEKGKIRQKIFDFQRRLAAAGFRPLFGGLGEGSGMGVGTIYDYPHRIENALHVMGRMAFLSGYQEFSANYDISPFGGTKLDFVADYQWRPNERFYGFGQDSLETNLSRFALRQSSLSIHWGQSAHRRIQFGAIYNLAALESEGATGTVEPSVGATFGDLPGLEEKLQVQSIGAYLGLDGFRGEYALSGRGQFGASWQESFGEVDVRYAKLEGFMEGRLPIVQGRSVLIGQAAADMLREGSGTEPVPFYLYPRIGGSATLRGFPLDRFYGRNMILATVEYRWLLHPGIEAQIFYDSGQIFAHTDDLSFFDWQRNYGFGIRFRNATGTQFRLEMASSAEGFSVHIIFGDRPLRTLGGGPVRYPLYRP